MVIAYKVLISIKTFFIMLGGIYCAIKCGKDPNQKDSTGEPHGIKEHKSES